MKTHTLDEMINKHVGVLGTANREMFEFELQIEIIGEYIKEIRKKQNLTQEQLGKIIGVGKAQISKIENNTSNISLETLVKIFKALQAKVKFQIEYSDKNTNLQFA